MDAKNRNIFKDFWRRELKGIISRNQFFKFVQAQPRKGYFGQGISCADWVEKNGLVDNDTRWGDIFGFIMRVYK